MKTQQNCIKNNNNKKNHLLISNAHSTQEWNLIVNTDMTENQRFLQQKLTLYILQI